MKNFTQKFIGLLALVFTMCFTVNAQEIGDIYEGGYLFYIDDANQTGLVASLTDIEELYVYAVPTVLWGCDNQEVEGADNMYIESGYQNTLDIVADDCEFEYAGIDQVTAAQAALDYESEGYSDWYLPSLEELREVYDVLGSIVYSDDYRFTSTEAVETHPACSNNHNNFIYNDLWSYFGL
jgi:hypothetical protein